MDKEQLKKIGGGILIIAALFVAYFFLVDSDTGTPLLLLEDRTVEEEKLVDDLFKILQDLNRVSIDTSILSDPLFANLEDFSVTIAPQEKGRPNPFAPF